MDFGSVTPSTHTISTRQQALACEEEAASKTSAAYRAPELTQCNYRPAQLIDGRVDIWGLGCTLYCFAFGRSPFETPQEGILKLGEWSLLLS